MRRIIVWILPVLAAWSIVGPAGAAAPEVTNVSFTQRTNGSMLVDVGYDVADADGDELAITLQASHDDGATWHVPVRRVSGDVGKGVLPGEGKNIVWDVGGDMPEREGFMLRVRVLASDEGELLPAHSPHICAIIDWQAIDWTQPGIFERYAKADLIVVTANQIWGRPAWNELRVLDKIRAVNPDVAIIGYVLAKTVQLDWVNTSGSSPFGQDLYAATRPYWCFTTTGDTLQDWWNQVNVNILEPDCRAGIIGVIDDYQNNSNNRFDGVFWDYFATYLWWPTHDLFEGEPDLDGDGVAHHDDPDEMDAYRQACADLVVEARAVLGEDFIQIFNGPRAQVDEEFARLSDGIHYELFPTQMFPAPAMANAMDPDLRHSMFNIAEWPRTEAGGPYNITSIIWQNFYTDYESVVTLLDLGNINRVVGLFTGAYTSWNSHGKYSYGWPAVDVSLGAPLGPTQIDYPHYTREFEFGRVEMTMESGSYPVPFSYRILINGEVVEEFDIPYHFP